MRHIREIDPPSAERFLNDIVPAGEPVVMRGLVSEWPWVSLGPKSLLKSVAEASLEKPVQTFSAHDRTNGRYFYDETLRGLNFERDSITLRSLTDRLGKGVDGHIYAGGVNIAEHLPSFLKDHPVPFLPDSVERLTSLWIGNRGRVPAHWDLPNNIAALVHGERTFTLFPPEQIENLYIGPLDFTLAGQPCSLVDIENPDFDKFPKAASALEAAYRVTLEPGDVIFIPSLWLHAVQNDGPIGVLVNVWWREAPAWAFTPKFTLYHALLSLRDLPLAERQRWRTLFDHYVFNANEETVEHIPEEARGVLSDLDPEMAEQLRSYLGRHLSRR